MSVVEEKHLGSIAGGGRIASFSTGAWFVFLLLVWLLFVYPPRCLWLWINGQTEEDGSED